VIGTVTCEYRPCSKDAKPEKKLSHYKKMNSRYGRTKRNGSGKKKQKVWKGEEGGDEERLVLDGFGHEEKEGGGV
jgi:hypothetical protein